MFFTNSSASALSCLRIWELFPFSKKEGAYFALVEFSDLEVQEVVITMLALVF